MDFFALLIGFLQVGVVLIGFIAIFLTFVLRDGVPTPARRFHARNMIAGAVGILNAVGIPLIILAFGWDDSSAARMAAGIQLAFSIPVGITAFRFYRHMPSVDRTAVGNKLFVPSMIALMFSSGLCVVIALGVYPVPLYTFGLYMTMMLAIWPLLVIAAEEMQLGKFDSPDPTARDAEE